jgi:hypothetical protein
LEYHGLLISRSGFSRLCRIRATKSEDIIQMMDIGIVDEQQAGA